MEQRIFDWVVHVKSDFRQVRNLHTFTHLRLYHGCRPLDPQTYYANGIVVMPFHALAQRFREIFCDFPPEALDQAIAKGNGKDHRSRVDAALDLRFLLNHASHYMVQGSERIKELAANLSTAKGTDLRDRLKTVGIPTAIVIEAPIDQIDEETIDDLNYQLETLAENGTCAVCDDGDMIDFTLSFPNGVPRSWIVNHHIVQEAIDPDDGRTTYRYMKSS